MLEDKLDNIKGIDCSIDVAVAWAVNAINSSNNVQGFSPSLLVFGYNPVLPSVRHGKPPALSRDQYSDIITEHLKTMKKARVAKIKAETSERARRALNHKWFYSDDRYLINDRVYYRRVADKSWQGPGTIIGHNGQSVLVKDESTWFRLHPCKLQKANGIETELEQNKNSDREQELKLEAQIEAEHQDEEIVDEPIQVSLHKKCEREIPAEKLASKVYNTCFSNNQINNEAKKKEAGDWQEIKVHEKDTDKGKGLISQKSVSRPNTDKKSMLSKSILRIMLLLITTSFLFTCMNISQNMENKKETCVYHGEMNYLGERNCNGESVTIENKTTKQIVIAVERLYDCIIVKGALDSILLKGNEKHPKNITDELACIKKCKREVIVNLVLRTKDTSIQIKEKGAAVDILIKEKGAAVDILIICYTANISMVIGCWPL